MSRNILAIVLILAPRDESVRMTFPERGQTDEIDPSEAEIARRRDERAGRGLCDKYRRNVDRLISRSENDYID